MSHCLWFTVKSGLNGTCEWNSQCTTNFSECKAPFNDTTENFQCLCRKYYQDVKGKCVPGKIMMYMFSVKRGSHIQEKPSRVSQV